MLTPQLSAAIANVRPASDRRLRMAAPKSALELMSCRVGAVELIIKTPIGDELGRSHAKNRKISRTEYFKWIGIQKHKISSDRGLFAVSSARM